MNVIMPIAEVARQAGVPEEAFLPYGRGRAKVDRTWVESAQPRGKLILVTAVNPTPPGEGKTTTSIGLADGLRQIGKSAALALREPSLGPVFGIKGGAIGGGKSQVVPATQINLHFNGDFAAIAAAQNLLAAIAENAAHFGTHDLDPRTLNVRRALDVNDRTLRQVVTGLGGRTGGIPRETGFDITAASEVMAAFCMASDLADLRRRIGGIVVGADRSGNPVTADTLQATGAMLALLVEAFSPNLVQTMEGTPAFVHGGPFANIAHGCNSVMATRAALATADYAVTEAGFGADLGAEKFLDIKCRETGLRPAAAVCVATVRALKYHGGVALADLETENVEAVRRGLANLRRHIQILRNVLGLNVVVAINRFSADTEAEMAVIAETTAQLGVKSVAAEHFTHGGKGAVALAEAVVEAAENPSTPTFTYAAEATLEEKIDAVVRKIYGGDGATFTRAAQRELDRLQASGYGSWPVCIAKTPASLTADPNVLGAPTDFKIPVREVRLSTGGGFVVVIAGSVMLMPGLPKRPSAADVDVTAEGEIVGLH
ncbi:formate--tetrahydrofolate ligase [Actinobaculum suis]|uniref:Formate--tetrahydrofolate ligase n=1 Tax=Actinobaculum suis TaxID=1657 RepID=A0A7Z9C947_9ACTO|nr:formate--tetrahydrofolate ligase [Actinobaculum suis]VDG77165.1 formate--tetrahydrofolate ligase [Actinobaculum suis]